MEKDTGIGEEKDKEDSEGKEQEDLEGSLAATAAQAARLEARAAALDQEKLRVERRIRAYEEASQAFCFSFSSLFGFREELVAALGDLTAQAATRAKAASAAATNAAESKGSEEGGFSGEEKVDPFAEVAVNSNHDPQYK